MKRLFLVNTPYQLIVSTLLSYQLKRNNETVDDIIITDNFVNSATIIEKVIKTGYYNKVFYATINEYLFSKNVFCKIYKILTYFFPKLSFWRKISNTFDFKYDEIYYNNDDLFFYNLISICTKSNSSLKVYRFEEGYSSYLNEFCSLFAQYICGIRDKIKMQNTFVNVFKGVYLYEPILVMYKSNVPFLKLSREINNDIKNIITSFFDLGNQYSCISEKWIIFEESFYQDKGYNKDIVLYKKIIDFLGKENVVVKMHPRTKIDRFTPMGIRTLENDGVPWEVVLLSGNIQNKIFVSMASGSIINAKLLLGDSTDSWLLYKCTEEMIVSMNHDFEDFINKLNGKGVLINLKIPSSYKDLEQLLLK